MSYINKLEIGKLLNRTELMPVVKDQILSTELSENDLFSLELYSLAKGEQISSHTLLAATLYIVLNGEIDISNNKVKELNYFYSPKSSTAKLLALEDSQIFIYTFKNEKALKNIISNKSTPLASQINLVKMAVSSKILIQEEEVSLTLFSLAVDEGLNTHKAGGDAMLLPLEGEINLKIADQPFTVNNSNIIILPAGIPHSLTATQPYKMLLTVVTK